jgi:phosphate transport system substrate-binding protein
MFDLFLSRKMLMTVSSPDVRPRWRKALLAASFLLVASGCSGERPNAISVVGSSTLFPFSSAAAEQFAARGLFRAPKVESTGTGGGLAIFCRGIGPNQPDIANASRRIKKGEFETCAKAGVTEIVEVKLGYDGIVIANAKAGPTAAFTKAQFWEGLAKEIWDEGQGKFIPNPHKRWSDVSPELPDIAIDVMGPPPTSGTRDAFVELVLEKGAADIPALKALKEQDDKEFKIRAGTLREDGAWKDSGENDNLIVQALSRSPEQFGVFGFSFYEENADRVQAAPLNGALPSAEAIIDGSYAASRSLYFYVKKAHVGKTAGLKEFAIELVSPQAAGLRGYLRGRGMVPLAPDELAVQQQTVEALKTMSAPEK